MRISVVIPTYNTGELVVEAIRSVLAQTLAAEEVIVVDDGSTDDTPDRMEEFGPPVRYIRQENGGPSAARNRGIEEAKGDWIAFLDGDDVWHPSKLAIQIAAMKREPSLILLGHGSYSWPGEIPSIDAAESREIRPVELDRLLIRNHFITSTLLVRRDMLLQAGPFDADLRGPEDYDMWLRVARLGKIANLENAPLTGYRAATPGSLSKNAERMEAGMRRILEKQEEVGMFRGRFWLRRKAWGYFRYSCGYMHYLAGDRWSSTRSLTRSIVAYPLPFRRSEVRFFLGRIRLLLKTVAR